MMSGSIRFNLKNLILNNIKLQKISSTNQAFIRNLSSSTSSDSEDEKERRLQNVDTFKCLNRVSLLGRATGPAMIQMLGNTQLASFTLVTNELHRNRSNELIKRSDFHKIQIFNPRMVVKAKQIIQKGSRIFIEGKINYNVRKGDHGNIHFTNITADNIVFITGSRPSGSIEDADEEELLEKEAETTH